MDASGGAPAHDIRHRRQTYVVLVLAIVANACGNLWLSQGMRALKAPRDWSMSSLLDLLGDALGSPEVLVGLPFLLLFFLLFLSLLSWADLSFVLPMVSYCFVVNALLAWLVLGERISLVRWVGIGLVTLGVYLVSQTHSREQGSQA